MFLLSGCWLDSNCHDVCRSTVNNSVGAIRCNLGGLHSRSLHFASIYSSIHSFECLCPSINLVSTSIYLYLPIYPSSTYQSLHSNIHPSTFISNDPSTHPSKIYPFVSAHQSILIPVCLSISARIFFTIYPSINLSNLLAVCQFIYFLFF